MHIDTHTILVTGAGSGIGRELAQRLQALGHFVVVAGRRMAPLRETIGGRGNMHAVVCDIADAQAIDAMAKRLIAEHPALDMVINNAGIMRFDAVGRHGDTGDAEAQITTNLLGPIRLNNALVDHLKQRAGATIVNVSSGLAFVPRADAAVYSATKAAIHLYTVALRQQLAGQVKVVELIPPAVQTELTPGQSVREGYMPLDAFMDEVMACFEQTLPDEIVVTRARMQRLAEREGRFDQVFAAINARAAGPAET